MSTIPKNSQLLKHLFELIEAHRHIITKQSRVFDRIVLLLLAEIMVFSRHTITQLLMSLGLTQRDWSAWYRLFSKLRLDMEKASHVVLGETLKHVEEKDLYVVAVDGTQTPRSSRKMEGSGWLRNMRTPPFMLGIHAAQRWLNGVWLTPPEGGYSRAVPLRWLPAFTAKSEPTTVEASSESQAALTFMKWLLSGLASYGRKAQKVLVVADGSYDTLALWKELPAGIILCARSAKNRALYYLAPQHQGRGRRRIYGDKAPTPQEVWANKDTVWQPVNIMVRGKMRHLQVSVHGPFLRRTANHRPLMLIVVRGKDNVNTRRQPLPFLVNAHQATDGSWHLPLAVETLLFWLWQRWEIEVCHRELKSNFGLGDKQAWNPNAAISTVQWSAWVYALYLLAGYRTWGLTKAPPVPTQWWTGAPRWSLNTLWRGYRAALWGQHQFHPTCLRKQHNWLEIDDFQAALRNAIFGSARS